MAAATQTNHYGTGRRKTATARVYLKPGNGRITVNDRTLDEFFEVLTWTQLGIHAKPCGILDAAGFFGPLRALVDGAVAAGFVHPAHRDMIVLDDDPARLLDRLAAWSPVTVSKWLDRTER